MNTKKKWRVRVAVWATYGGKFQAYVDATQNGREVAGFYGEPRPTALAAEDDHIIEYDHEHPERGGPTSLANLHRLCWQHHQMKTAGLIDPTRAPVDDSAPLWSKPRNTAGDISRFTPPAMAVSHSPLRRLRQARCSATSDDEQAVSTVTDGPRRSSW